MILPLLLRDDLGGSPADVLAAARGDLGRQLPPDEVAIVAAAAALGAGEPKRAGRLLDGASPPPDSNAHAMVQALRAVAAALDLNWFPGGGGSVLEEGDVERLGIPPVEFAAADASLVVLMATCVTMAPAWRTVATGARRLNRPTEGSDVAAAISKLGADVARFDAPEALGYVTRLHADVLWRTGQGGQAIALAQSARELYRRSGHLVGLGALHLLEGDWAADPLSHPELLGLDLDGLVPQGAAVPPDRETARRRYEEAKDCFVRGGAGRGQAAVELRLARLDALDGEHARAQQGRQRAVALATEAGDTALARLGLVHHALGAIAAGGEPDASLGPFVSEWASGDGSTSYARGLSRLCHAQARSWREAGEFGRARAALRLAEDINQGLGTTTEPVLVRDEIAELYGGANYRRAVLALAELDLAEQTAVLEGASGSADNDDIERRWMRLLDKALSAFNAAVGLADADAIEAVTERLGAVAVLRPGAPSDGPPQEASFDPSQQASDVLSWTLPLARVLVPLYRGTAARERGHVDEADRHLADALRAAEALGPGFEFVRVLVLATLRRREEAVALADAVVAAGGLSPDQAAELYLRLRQYDKAMAQLARLDEQGGPRFPGRPWEDPARRAEAYAGLGRLEEAESLAARAVQLFETHLARLTRDVLRVTATDEVGITRLYSTALRVQLDRAGVVRDGPGETTAEDAMAVAAAFGLSDRCRGVALADLLAVDQAAGTDPEVVAAVREWHRRGAELARTFERLAAGEESGGPAEARRRIAEVEAALDDAEVAVQRWAPALMAARRQPPPSPSLNEAQALLPADTLLVQYHAFDDELVAWAVTRDRARAVRRTAATADLAGLTRRFHTACATRGTSPHERKELGAELAALLIGPLQPELEAHERVVVAPHAVLTVLPFHLLPHGGDLLGLSHKVSYLPAVSVLPRWGGERRPPHLQDRAVVVGDPEYARGRGLRQLPGARTEATTVAQRLGVAPYIGPAATEDGVSRALPGAAVVHLATHGLLHEDAPASAELTLAGEDSLTIPDLLGLDTDIDLAVLSACHSGRGRATTSGEFVGFTRALLAAGARDLVVSLWPVDDLAGCLAVVALYERLLAGEDVTTALRTAQRQLQTMDQAARDTRYGTLCAEAGTEPGDATVTARDWPSVAARPPAAADDPGHPYYWAPFVHVGL